VGYVGIAVEDESTSMGAWASMVFLEQPLFLIFFVMKRLHRPKNDG
jgi:hypothetical protein